MDWAGEKNVCSAYACPALRRLGTSSLPTRLGDSSNAIATHDSLTKNFGVWGVHVKHNQAKHVMPCKNHVMPCKNRAKPVGRQKPCKSYSPRSYVHVWLESAAGQKNWPRKMASWQDNYNRSRRPRTAAPGDGRNDEAPGCGRTEPSESESGVVGVICPGSRPPCGAKGASGRGGGR